MPFKIAVVPCNGTARLASTVARRAAYRAVAVLREEAELVSISRALVAPRKQSGPLDSDPIVVIDGCRRRCASAFMAKTRRQKNLAASVYVPEILAGSGIDLRGEGRRELGKGGVQLVEAVASAVVEHAARLRGDRNRTAGFLEEVDRMAARWSELQRSAKEASNGGRQGAGEALREAAEGLEQLFRECRALEAPAAYAQLRNVAAEALASRARAAEALYTGNLAKHQTLSEQADRLQWLFTSELRKAKQTAPPVPGGGAA